ncbi:MAG: TrkA family potassium uptake protein [Pacificimonas sp.]
MTSDAPQKYAVLGLGPFGSEMARQLAGEGSEVLIIDHDEDAVQALSDEVEVAVIADVCDEDAVREAGVTKDHCAIVAIDHAIEPSALAVIALQNIGVTRIMAKARDEKHALILERLGADEVVNPDREAASRLTSRLCGGDGDS